MNLDSTKIIDSLPNPIFLARPYFNNNTLVDFEIVYMNELMKKTANHIFQNSTKWSEFGPRTTGTIPWQQMIIATLNNKPVPEFTYYDPTKKLWYRIDISVFVNQEEKLILALFTDISKEKIYINKLSESVTRDSLTGLLNRTILNETLDFAINTTQFKNTYAALLILDIDNLKNINDSLGTAAGDEKIIEAANVLKKFERESIKIFRYGGDEFLVLIYNVESIDSINNICDAIYEAFMFNQLELSGGISVFPDSSEQKEELITFADMALHCAKKNGKNNFTYFEPEMQRIFIQHLTLQAKMTNAIILSAFNQYYQPQFDIQTGVLRGFEALIRWTDKELGEIPPSVFIPLAEESGSILSIGKWVLKTAIATLKKWQDDYNFKGIMSVNISPIQLRQDNFIEELTDLINFYQIDPNYLELEITEGVMIKNMDIAIDKLEIVRNLGVKISLDDFGTGYSSLSYLQALPLNTLKIDKSFINNICSDDGVQATITSSIISMVEKMGLETIAEGVENYAQLELLSKFNCTVVQGFLRGKPMNFESCDAYLAGDNTALITNSHDL